jgi:hypothetical protein
MTFEWVFGLKDLFEKTIPVVRLAFSDGWKRSCLSLISIDLGELHVASEQAKIEFEWLRRDCAERDWRGRGRSFVSFRNRVIQGNNL